MLVERVSIVVAVALLLLLPLNSRVSAAALSPESDFLASNLRPPNGISTDPTYDKQCIIANTNGVNSRELILHFVILLTTLCIA